MHKYRLVAKKGEGTFSEVLKAQCIKNSKYVAIKCMKNHFDSLEQVNNLREIQALRRLSPHANVIKLLEVLYDQPTGRLALVFELMDMNIYELIRGRRHYVAEEKTKNYMYQLMKAMDHVHRNGIFHRDIKPENILIMEDNLKLADFGSCRGIYSKQPYTEYISTRWYRAPECLLTDGYYNYKMDMWGVGCVFFEIVSLFPLFPGTNELDQIHKIHNILGTPPPEVLEKMKRRSQHMDFSFPPKEGSGIEKLIPHAQPECVELINKLLAYNPDERLSARQALRHAYFKELRENEKRQQAAANAEASVSINPSPRFPPAQEVQAVQRKTLKEVGGKAAGAGGGAGAASGVNIAGGHAAHRGMAAGPVAEKESRDKVAEASHDNTPHNRPVVSSSTQLPSISAASKRKEHVVQEEKENDAGGGMGGAAAGPNVDEGASTVLPSMVHPVSRGPSDTVNNVREPDSNDAAGGGVAQASGSLPPIKGSHNLAALSPKPSHAVAAAAAARAKQQQQPAAHSGSQFPQPLLPKARKKGK